MLQNIIEMDYLSKTYALTEVRPAIILFDFKAAFPSIAHDFIWQVLKDIGLPTGWIKVIQLFYHNHLQVMGKTGSHQFNASTGIRQGCPLSPLLFAVVADILLRIIKKRMGNQGVARAFADDTAMALKNIGDLNYLLEIFDDYGDISNLRLNLAKTVVIPLFLPQNWLEARRIVLGTVPRTELMKITLSAMYLGVHLGPEGFLQGWQAPIAKFTERINKWGSIFLGVLGDTKTYKIFCFSVLQFYLQFYELPEGITNLEKKASARIFKGPGKWISEADIAALYSQLGAPFSLPRARDTSLATRLRLLLTEPFLRNSNRQREIQHLQENPDGPQNFLLHPWQNWFDDGIIGHIYKADAEGTRRGIRKRDVWLNNENLHNTMGETSRTHYLQKTALSMMWDEERDIDERIRNKLERWQLPGRPATNTSRARKMINAAFKFTAPRVAYAYFSMLWNGWTTSRRFQRRDKCVICGKEGTADSIEHYLLCHLSQLLATNIFRMRHSRDYVDRGIFLQDKFALNKYIEKDELVTKLLYIHVIYSLQNLCRRTGPLLPGFALDRGRTLLARAAEGEKHSRKIAAALLGPPGPLRPTFQRPIILDAPPRKQIRVAPAHDLP